MGVVAFFVIMGVLFLFIALGAVKIADILAESSFFKRKVKPFIGRHPIIYRLFILAVIAFVLFVTIHNCYWAYDAWQSQPQPTFTPFGWR